MRKIVYTPLKKIGINYLKIKRSNDDNPTQLIEDPKTKENDHSPNL